jgi:hypothetical protein
VNDEVAGCLTLLQVLAIGVQRLRAELLGDDAAAVLAIERAIELPLAD